MHESGSRGTAGFTGYPENHTDLLVSGSPQQGAGARGSPVCWSGRTLTCVAGYQVGETLPAPYTEPGGLDLPDLQGISTH